MAPVNDISGENITGHTLISPQKTIEAYSLPKVKSARAAELIALTRTCALLEGKTATNYTDFK